MLGSVVLDLVRFKPVGLVNVAGAGVCSVRCSSQTRRVGQALERAKPSLQYEVVRRVGAAIDREMS